MANQTLQVQFNLSYGKWFENPIMVRSNLIVCQFFSIYIRFEASHYLLVRNLTFLGQKALTDLLPSIIYCTSNVSSTSLHFQYFNIISQQNKQSSFIKYMNPRPKCNNFGGNYGKCIYSIGRWFMV
jgi:hypothetical protein